jgi:hypothetical protein
MTEDELIEAGFQKQECNHLESGNGYDYYYYTNEVCEGIYLVSSDSDELKDGKWWVYSHDIPIKIRTKEKLQEFLELINYIKDDQTI